MYGVEYSIQNKDVKEKSKQTNLKLYGVENVFQNDDIKEKIKQTLLKRYNVNNPTKNKEFVEKAINTCIERYGEAFFHITPKHNPNSIFYLDLISEKCGYVIKHAVNDKEQKFHKYWVDGYIKELNICIEWDEQKHNQPKVKEKDLIREKYIIDNFNCKFIRINEKEFLKDIYNNIDNIVNKINVF